MGKPKKTDEEKLEELEAKQAHLSKQLDGLWPHIKRLRANIIRANFDKLSKRGITPKADAMTPQERQAEVNRLVGELSGMGGFVGISVPVKK